MKKISCIQNYVIDKLIEDRKLSTAGLLDAISKVCSTEQFDNVLSILIEMPFPCINKENSEDKECLVKMNMFVPEEVSSETRMQIIKILKEQFNTISIRLKEAKDYVDSCIGEYNMFPKVITKEEVNEIIKKLKPYNVGINIIKLMQQKYCTYTVRILDKHVGLISIHTEQVRTGKLKILICKIVLVQTLKSCSITIFHILIQQRASESCYTYQS